MEEVLLQNSIFAEEEINAIVIVKLVWHLFFLLVAFCSHLCMESLPWSLDLTAELL